MRERAFYWGSGTVFTVVAILHLIRSIMGWNVRIHEWNVPVGVSVVLFLLAGFLAFTAFRLSAHDGHVQKTKEQKQTGDNNVWQNKP